MDLTDNELDKLLEDVATELLPILKSEGSTLMKGFDGGSPSPEGSSPSASPEESSGSPSASAEGSPGEGSASVMPPGDGAPPMDGSAFAAPPAGPPAASAAPPSAPASPPTPAGSAPMVPTDPAALQAMVSTMPPEQQDALYLAIKNAIFARGPASPDMGAPQGAPPAPPSPAPSPASPPPPAMKAEKPMGEPKPGVRAPNANGEHVVGSVHKSELDAVKATAEKQGEEIKLLTKALEITLSQPLRKSFTGVSQLRAIQKPVPEADEGLSLSKSEIAARLRGLDRKALSKSDREKINKFYNTGSEDIALVKHLLQQEAQ